MGAAICTSDVVSGQVTAVVLNLLLTSDHIIKASNLQVL